jgi:PHD/YefM family antitoxin component YafN of YafNO toxin-antitoxin module
MNKRLQRMELHPEFITRNGKREFAVLPYEEFMALQEQMADLEDLLDLRAAKRAERTASTASLIEVKDQLGLR